VEWVETTGKSIEEAKELALDQLGVDSGDAEFEVIEEPKVGLFGRTRSGARVRARVVPKSPRAKTERRRRPKKSDSTKPSGSAAAESGGDEATADPVEKAPAGDTGEVADRPRSRRGGGQRGEGAPEQQSREREAREPMDMDEQSEVLTTFLVQLADSFGLTVETEVTVDEDDLRVNLLGDGLGLLVGPRLATLDAIQEIARNALQRQAEGREYARVLVDVQGIRERRREALSEFVAEAAGQVRDDDVTVVFEVMSSADRKIVHDVATELDGVASASEGEDPRRRVVLRRS
jgi:spoIIIJ-associated protein